MTGALLYLSARTLRNRLLAAARRLRRPRYLISFLVGAAYFYLFAVRHWIDSARFARGAGAPLPPRELMESIAALVVTGLVLLAWCAPAPASPVGFTEAEVHFLFPAPLTRRALLRWKLVRGQLGLLFGVLVVAAGLGPRAASAGMPVFLAGVWLVFTTVQCHLAGIRIALHRLEARAGWALRLAAAGAALSALALVHAAWTVRRIGPVSEALEGGLVEYAQRLLTAGPLGWLLLPARLLVRPAFAATAAEFFLWLPLALALLAGSYLWVVGRPVALEEGALEAARRAGLRRQRRASGRPARLLPIRARRSPFRLAPTGRPETALLWKALLALLRGAGGGQALVLLAPAALVPMMAILILRGRLAAVGAIVGAMCGALAAVLLILGPAILRSDVREELLHIDLLKSYPLTGRSIIAGTLVGPVLIVTALQWLLLATFAALTVPTIGSGPIPRGHLGPAVLAICLVAPGVNLVSSLVNNAALLMVPGWLTLGAQKGGAGLERFGQSLIAAFARTLALAVGLLPAAAVFAAAWFFGSAFLRPAAALALSAVPALAILGTEAWIGLLMLGAYLERFDSAAELDALGR